MQDAEPVFEGSGVLLKIAETAIVLSAGHVLEAAKEAALLLGPMTGGSRFVPLPGPFQVSRDQDAVDVGFARLPGDVAAKLAEYEKRFLRLNELEFVKEPSAGFYSVVGFPKIVNTPNYSTRVIDVMPFNYGTFLCVEPPDIFKPGTSIAVRWTANSITTHDGDPVRMPELGGISGCGMWRLYGSEDCERLDFWDPSWIRLSGIEHRVSPKKWIKGTLIRRVIELIRHDYADLRPSIDLTMPT